MAYQAGGTTREPLWDGFREYLLKPYENNPRQTGVLQNWYDGLRQRSDVHLDYAQITNSTTGHTFDAYAINKQIIFSHDKAVLTVPFPRSTQDNSQNIYPDQLVGAWLHDFGHDQGFHDLVAQRARENRIRPVDNTEFRVSDAESGLQPHLQKILNGIKTINDPTLPGGNANNIPNAMIRFLGSDERAAGTHRDNQLSRDNSSADVFRNTPYVWSRQPLVPIFGNGTRYALDGNDTYETHDPMPVQIDMPSGVPYAHITFFSEQHPAQPIEGFRKWGIRHAAPFDPGGRAALLKSIDDHRWESVQNEPSPWQIEHLPSPPGIRLSSDMRGVQASAPPRSAMRGETPVPTGQDSPVADKRTSQPSPLAGLDA